MKANVHRKIGRSSPVAKGGDVRALQERLNVLLKHWKLPHRKLKVDGEAGPKTFKAAHLMGFALGLSKKQLGRIKRGVLTEHSQKIIRNAGLKTERRSRDHYRRAKARRKRVATIRKKKNNKVNKVLAASSKMVGQHESPAGSNRGPGIVSKCQINILGYDGNPWCGCFTGDLTRRFGKVGAITSRVAFTPYTADDARAGRNGFIAAVSPEQAKPGDHSLYNFGSGGIVHTGLVLRHVAGGIIAREGNTSGGSSGSQDNGGGVYDRFRSYSDIVVCARPNWK